jgi:hypothetical protein
VEENMASNIVSSWAGGAEIGNEFILSFRRLLVGIGRKRGAVQSAKDSYFTANFPSLRAVEHEWEYALL